MPDALTRRLRKLEAAAAADEGEDVVIRVVYDRQPGDPPEAAAPARDWSRVRVRSVRVVYERPDEEKIFEKRPGGVPENRRETGA